MRRFLVLSFAVVILAGCAQDSFLNRRYSNFTAYYNTFFNARKLYTQGVEALERAAEQELDRNVYLAIFTAPGRVSSQQTFNDAIIKSADVLRDHPDTKWVDDALMLIGKSYFYLENYVGAEQKFLEIIELGGELADEARFWLARTYTSSQAYETAEQHLNESLAIEGLSSEWEPMLRMALGELYVREQNWVAAVAEVEQGLRRLKDKTLSARGFFLLGQIYETLGDYERAVRSFTTVQDLKPEYPLVFASMVSQVRIEGKHGDAQEGFRMLRAMMRDDKHYDSQAELIFLQGRLLQWTNRPDDAYFTLTDDLLYTEDATISIQRVRGKALYALGEIFRDDYVDYTYAAAYFDSASSSIRLGPTGGSSSSVNVAEINYTPEAIIDAEEQAEVFGNYAQVFDQVAHLDSLLWLGQMEEEEFDAFILDLRRAKAEEQAEQQRELERRQAEQSFRNMSSAGIPGQSRKIIDSSASKSLGDSENGFLFYKNPVRVQEGRLSFITRWGERPLVPNWRREEAILIQQAAAENTETGEEAVPLGSLSLSETGLPVINYSDVPRTLNDQEEMRVERSLVQYELANVLFLGMAKPDSAAAWYRLVIDEAGEQPVGQRAYYALAEVQRAIGDTLSARQLYGEVLQRYPDSDFANRVREQLGLELIDNSAPDSLLLAEAAYQQAYVSWRQNEYPQAVTHMLQLASAYPVGDMSPRALLATGTIYMEWAIRDSLDVYALPLPEVPDSVLAYYGLIDSVAVLAPILHGDGISPSDSVETVQPPDTTATAELLLPEIPADSVAMAEGNRPEMPPADSLAISPGVDSLAVPQHDSVMVKAPYIRLDRLFSSVKSMYPSTPHAEVADRMLRAIAELRPEEALIEAIAAEDERKMYESMSPEEFALKGPDPIDPQAPGWTLVVGSFAERENALGLLAKYQEQGFRAVILQGATRARVCLGQFVDLDQAKLGLALVKDEVPGNTWFMDILKPR